MQESLFVVPSITESCEVTIIDDPHVCEKCGLIFTNALEYHGHFSSEGNYQCEICDEKFKCVFEFEKHKNEHQKLQKNPPFICNVCGEEFNNYNNLLSHKVIHDKVFNCPVCEKSYKKKSSLLKHCTIHTSNEESKSLIDSSDFILSDDQQEQTDDLYECDTCNKEFSSAKKYRAHLNKHRKPKNLPPFVCKICNKEFEKYGQLYTHHMVHNSKRPYVCEICSKSYKKKSHLRRHFYSHLDQKPYKCDICDRGFVDRTNLKKHSYTHTREKAFMCEICGKQFAVRTRLILHKFTHSKDSPHKCEVCHKRFTTLYNLKKHLFSHTQDFPFVCMICEKGYATAGYLAKHGLSHVAVRYECAECGKKFRVEERYNRHILEHIEKRKISEVGDDRNQQQEDCHNLSPDSSEVMKFLENPSVTTEDIREKSLQKDCTTNFSAISKYSSTLQQKNEDNSNTPNFSLVSSFQENTVTEKNTKGWSSTTIKSQKEHDYKMLRTEFYKCNACNKRFKSMSLFKKHYLTHKKLNRISKKNTDDYSVINLDRQNFSNKNINTSLNQCKICDKICKSSTSLKQHYTAHEKSLSLPAVGKSQSFNKLKIDNVNTFETTPLNVPASASSLNVLKWDGLKLSRLVPLKFSTNISNKEKLKFVNSATLNFKTTDDIHQISEKIIKVCETQKMSKVKKTIPIIRSSSLRKKSIFNSFSSAVTDTFPDNLSTVDKELCENVQQSVISSPDLNNEETGNLNVGRMSSPVKSKNQFIPNLTVCPVIVNLGKTIPL